jgi:hypothetical protein
LLSGVRAHLCASNASSASADDATAVGTSLGRRSFQPQELQPHPIKNVTRIQISSRFASPMRTIVSQKSLIVEKKTATSTLDFPK